MGIRLAIGAFKSNPVPSNLAEANQFLLDLRREKAVIKYTSSLKKPPQENITLQNLPEIINKHLYLRQKSLPKPYPLRLEEYLQNHQNTELFNSSVASKRIHSSPPWTHPHIQNKSLYPSTNINQSQYTLNYLQTTLQ